MHAISTLICNYIHVVMLLNMFQDKIDDDNDSRCFICSIKKDVFERNGLVSYTVIKSYGIILKII